MIYKFSHRLLMALACLAGISAALAQTLTFTTNTYSAGSEPLIAVGDVNGDGRLDLLTGNWNSNNITVLTNNGLGGFGYYATFAAGIEPEVTLADVNGDGNPYMITVNGSSKGTITVLTNNGFGDYGSNATLNVGRFPQNLIVADINGDGKLDLISANLAENPGTLSVLTNNGYGVFGSNATLNVGSKPQCTVAADVNGDGYVDLMTANIGDDTITVLTNNGRGSFVLSQTLTLPSGSKPQWLLGTDVNGDGKVDLVCPDVGTNTLTIFTNNGHGIFGSNATLTVGNGPSCVVAADLNGDGKPDLISANSGGWETGTNNTLTVLTNNGYGVFGSNTTLTVGTLPYFLVAADVNADGKPDLITANFKDNTVTVLLNTTAFPPATNQPKLAITYEGKQTRVSWPSVSPGWELQENSDLTRLVWLPSGYTGYLIADDGTNKSLTLTSQTGNRFFHLLHP